MWKTSGLLLVLALFVTGCGGGVAMAPVKGKVTLGGVGLKKAQVLFVPLEAGQPPGGVAYTNENGEYVLGPKDDPRIPAGKYRVEIRTGMENEKMEGDKKVIEKTPELVPEEYNKNSKLIREVKEGEDNVFNFDIKSKKPAE